MVTPWYPHSPKILAFCFTKLKFSSTIIQVFESGSKKTQGIRKELLPTESTPFKEHS